MRHIIIIQCDNLDEQYRESRAYLDDKYHDHPTRLRDIPITDDTWYNNQAPQHRQHSTRPERMRVK